MATKTTVELVCDITGEPAKRTVHFAVDNRDYEIDLSAEALADFEAAIAGFVESARPAGKSAVSAKGVTWAGKRAQREETAKVKEWAAQHGITVADRGRVAKRVLDAYQQGNPALAAAG